MARRPDNSVPGLLVVDKDPGMTSHDVVSRLRRIAGTRKVGHAGTLDPMATGVLVLGIGKATRLLTFVTGSSKTYLATARLGITTSTEDAEGDITSARGCEAVPDDRVEQAMAALRGDIMQVPSKVSAIKIDGKRAHARVRAGEEVEIPARPVRIDRFELTAPTRPSTVVLEDGEVPVLDIDLLVECSSGTYVRALARDLGEALGCGAHLTALRRTRVGPFTLHDAATLAVLQAEHRGETGQQAVAPPSSMTREGPEPAPRLIPLDDAVGALFPRLDIDEAEATRFANGQAPHREVDCHGRLAGCGDAPIGVFGPDGRTMGLVRCEEGRLRTVLVF